MSDKMREEFEVFCDKHNYRTDKSKSGGYVYHVTSSCWDAWQASRQTLAIELPKPEWAEQDDYKELVKERLDNAGIKWKE